MRLWRKIKIGVGVVIAAGAVSAALADGVQPIVTPGQALYGSGQHTITSNSDVLIDTTTHILTDYRGIKTSSITFKDGTILTSSGGIVATSAWGTITGTLSNQTDLQTKFNGVAASTTTLGASVSGLTTSTTTLGTQVASIGTSTASLQTQITATAITTGTLQSSITSLNSSIAGLAASTTTLSVSTVSLQNQINTLSTSTSTIQTQVNNIVVSTAALAVSTASLQSQINGLGSTYLTISSATTTYLQTSSATSTYLQTSSATATYANRNNYATAVTTGLLTASDWVTFNGKVQSVNGGSGISVTGGGAPTVSVSSISLSTQVVGNLGITNLDSGTNADVNHFWAGSGHWLTVPSVGGASTLAFSTGSASASTIVSSPTKNAVMDSSVFTGSLVGATSFFMTLNSSSATLQGNTFNIANKLVQLTSGGQYPAADGNLITNINSMSVTGVTKNQIALGSSSGLSSSSNATFDGSTLTVTGNMILLRNQGTSPAISGNGAVIVNPNFAGAFYNTLGFTSTNGFYNILTTTPTYNWGEQQFGTLNENLPVFGLWLYDETFLGGWDTGASPGASYGFEIGTSVGRNKLDVAGNAMIGGDFTVAGTNSCGLSSNAACGSIAPANGLAIEGNVIVGTATAISGSSQFQISASTSNKYAIYIATSNVGGWSVSIDTTTGAYFKDGNRFLHNYSNNGTGNVFVGNGAGNFSNSGSWNIGVGPAVFQSLTTGIGNTGSGYAVLSQLTNGNNNTAFGYESMNALTSSSGNTAFGSQALFQQTNGDRNVALGYQALELSTSGVNNVAIGYQALQNGNSSSGTFSSNIGIGRQAGAREFGVGNIYIGDQSGPLANAVLTNSIAIGDGAIAASSNTIVLGASTNLTVNTYGHIVTNGTAPTLNACGTGSPSVVGDDNQGVITTGGGSPTACGLLFANNWGSGALNCEISDNIAATSAEVQSVTASSATFVLSAGLSSGNIFYRCGCSGTGCK